MQSIPTFSAPHKYTLVDAHEVYKRLLAAGFNEQQAEEVTNVLNSIDLNHLASKQDVEDCRDELKAEINELGNELRNEMKMLEMRLDIKFAELEIRLSDKIYNAQMTIIKWFIPLLLGQVAIFGFIVKFL